MKKMLSLLCVCVMLLTMLPVIGASADEAVTITVETVKTAPLAAGKTFELKISTSRIAEVAGFELHLKYDASRLLAVKGTASGWLSELEMNTVNCELKNPLPDENGVPMKEVRLTGMSLQNRDSAEGEVVATITFKTLTAITEDVPLVAFGPNNMVLAHDGKEIKSLPLTIVNGGLKMSKVKITAESSTAAYAEKDKVASVSVTAVGDGLTYTWYLKNPGGTRYSKSSVTTASYGAKMTAANSGRLVYCVVKDKYGNQAQSKTFVLRMKATITSVPATAAYAKTGEKVSVTIGAAGDGLTYAWYIKNAGQTKYSKSSITGATYTTAMNSTTKNRLLYCVVKDKYGKTAQTKTFVLREAVSIATQPQSVTVANGATAKVTVKASGDGLTYTWYIKNAGQTKYTKSSITAPTYSAKMSSTSKNRLVYCVVKDQYGKTVKSNTVQLKMK